MRLERKGHGGKEVTVVECLELGPALRETWLCELKQALGCGGAVEGDRLVLQGDQRERVRDWLVRRGVGGDPTEVRSSSSSRPRNTLA